MIHLMVNLIKFLQMVKILGILCCRDISSVLRQCTCLPHKIIQDIKYTQYQNCRYHFPPHMPFIQRENIVFFPLKNLSFFTIPVRRVFSNESVNRDIESQSSFQYNSCSIISLPPCKPCTAFCGHPKAKQKFPGCRTKP